MSRPARTDWPLPPEIEEPAPPTERRSWGKVSHSERYRRQRRDLLRAAARLASREGYPGTRVADIVKEAGLSKSTFYEHFASKDDCILELYRRTSAQMLLAGVNTAEATIDKGPKTCLLEVIRALVGYTDRNPRLAAVLGSELGESDAIRKQREENRRRTIAFFTTLARRLDTRLDGDALELTSTILVRGVTEILADLRRSPETLDARLATIASLACRAWELPTG